MIFIKLSSRQVFSSIRAITLCALALIYVDINHSIAGTDKELDRALEQLQKLNVDRALEKARKKSTNEYFDIGQIISVKTVESMNKFHKSVLELTKIAKNKNTSKQKFINLIIKTRHQLEDLTFGSQRISRKELAYVKFNLESASFSITDETSSRLFLCSPDLWPKKPEFLKFTHTALRNALQQTCVNLYEEFGVYGFRYADLDAITENQSNIYKRLVALRYYNKPIPVSAIRSISGIMQVGIEENDEYDNQKLIKNLISQSGVVGGFVVPVVELSETILQLGNVELSLNILRLLDGIDPTLREAYEQELSIKYGLRRQKRINEISPDNLESEINNQTLYLKEKMFDWSNPENYLRHRTLSHRMRKIYSPLTTLNGPYAEQFLMSSEMAFREQFQKYASIGSSLSVREKYIQSCKNGCALDAFVSIGGAAVAGGVGVYTGQPWMLYSAVSTLVTAVPYYTVRCTEDCVADANLVRDSLNEISESAEVERSADKETKEIREQEKSEAARKSQDDSEAAEKKDREKEARRQKAQKDAEDATIINNERITEALKKAEERKHSLCLGFDECEIAKECRDGCEENSGKYDPFKPPVIITLIKITQDEFLPFLPAFQSEIEKGVVRIKIRHTDPPESDFDSFWEKCLAGICARNPEFSDPQLGVIDPPRP